jgi:RNA-directed DNA polymerase
MSSMAETKAPRHKSALDPVSESWRKLPWRKLEHQMYRIQKRLFRAEERGNEQAVRQLQKLWRKSRAARLIAVRRMTQDNQGKRTAGIDGVQSVPPKQRWTMGEQIHPREWKRSQARLVRRVYSPKPGKDEKRPLGIPVRQDRAQQALGKSALEPAWEAKVEPNSYGFRPGPSGHDAIGAIFTAISKKDKDVLDADSKGCFAHIDQSALLTKLGGYPALHQAGNAWLQAGILTEGVFEPTEKGTPQGGVISPLFANIALLGRETAVRAAFTLKEKKPNFIR